MNGIAMMIKTFKRIKVKGVAGGRAIRGFAKAAVRLIEGALNRYYP